MLNPFFSLCVYLVEMVISYIFFFAIFENRYPPIKCLFIGSILFALGSTVNIICNNNGVINVLATFVINILFAHICFDANLYKGLFYSALLGIINGAVEVTVVFISSFMTSSEFLKYNTSFILSISQAITIKMLYFSIILILIKFIHPENNQSAIPIEFLIYPTTTTACQAVFWYICAQPDISYLVQFLLSLASVCLFISSILLFITYSHQVKKESEALQVKSELSRLLTEQSYYQILDQQNQQLMIYAHDAKKHLAAIQALNDDPRIENYVLKLSEQLADYTHNCHSGNKLLDVMIHKYFIDCEMKGIRFDYEVKLCNLTVVEDIDLVAILGNLMDNAITAAEQSLDKRVSLATAIRNTYNVIVISNSCDKPPKTSGNHLISSKEDKIVHGFGLKSIARALKKYNGDFEWIYDLPSQTFTVTVMLSGRSE